MYIPKNKQKYSDKAQAVKETFIKTKGDFEETARIHWFRNIGSVYRYLRFAGYKFPDRQRDVFGRYSSVKKGKK